MRERQTANGDQNNDAAAAKSESGHQSQAQKAARWGDGVNDGVAEAAARVVVVCVGGDGGRRNGES